MAYFKSLDTHPLLVRTVLPSSLSLLCGLFFGASMTILHLASISLKVGTILPNSPDSESGLFYTNYVVGPLLRVLHSHSFSIAITVMVWATFGWLLVSLVQYIARAIKELRAAQTNVEVTPTKVVRHPQRQEYTMRVIWRAASLVVFILFVLFSQPIIHRLLAMDYRIFAGFSSASDNLILILMNVLIWSLLFHCVVVFIRFYSFRTRVFGELLY